MACEAHFRLRTLRRLRNVFRMTQPLRTTPGGGGTDGAEDTSEGAYLKVKDVAATLNVSVRHVHNLAHRGDLDFIMPGRVMRITEASLRAYIARSHVAAS